MLFFLSDKCVLEYKFKRSVFCLLIIEFFNVSVSRLFKFSLYLLLFNLRKRILLLLVIKVYSPTSILLIDSYTDLERLLEFVHPNFPPSKEVFEILNLFADLANPYFSI